MLIFRRFLIALNPQLLWFFVNGESPDQVVLIPGEEVNFLNSLSALALYYILKIPAKHIECFFVGRNVLIGLKSFGIQILYSLDGTFLNSPEQAVHPQDLKRAGCLALRTSQSIWAMILVPNRPGRTIMGGQVEAANALAYSHSLNYLAVFPPMHLP